MVQFTRGRFLRLMQNRKKKLRKLPAHEKFHFYYGMSNVAMLNFFHLHCIIAYWFCIIAQLYGIIAHLYCRFAHLHCICGFDIWYNFEMKEALRYKKRVLLRWIEGGDSIIAFSLKVLFTSV